MSDPIKDAIIAAGQELSRQHAWRLDHDDDKDADQTLFFRVVYRHVFRAAMPEHIRAARIAELEAELSTMEQCGRAVADVVQQSAERIAELESALSSLLAGVEQQGGRGYDMDYRVETARASLKAAHEA